MMIGFYHGTAIPGNNAKEGIYFIKNNNTYSIYAKVKEQDLQLYANVNEVTSETIDNLWSQIGETFVAKTFTIAGLDLQDNIEVEELTEALKLKALAYKDSATGTLEDYVVEVNEFTYQPTGRVEIHLGSDSTSITSEGSFYPLGEVEGTVVPEGEVVLSKDENGFEITGSISAPEITPIVDTATIKQISSVGTLPSYTAATYTAPSLTSDKASFASNGMVASMGENQTLVFTWADKNDAIVDMNFDAGAYTAAQFNPGSLPTIDDSLSVVKEIKEITASKPVFTGDKIKADFVGQESVIDAIFTGSQTQVVVQGAYDKVKVNSATFIGNEATLQPTLKKENKTIIVE
jgi:hypothetical protein